MAEKKVDQGAYKTDGESNELLSGDEPILAAGSVTEHGQVVGQDAVANPNRLSGNVSNAEIRENLVGTAPTNVSNPYANTSGQDRIGGDVLNPPRQHDQLDGGRATTTIDDGDGVVDPQTRSVDASQPEYKAVHNDTATPDYRDETYRNRDQSIRDPNSGFTPTSSPKENNAY